MEDNNNDSDEHDAHPEEKIPVDIAAIEEAIQSAIERGTLIQMARDSDAHSFWEGFPLVVSNNLVLMRTVLDFRADGFSVMRLTDIHEVRENESQVFLLHVLRSEGRLENLAPPKPILLRSWRTVLESVKAHYRTAIIECEHSDDGFLLGELSETDEEETSLYYIFGDGTREAGLTNVAHDEITLVRFGEDYINLLGRYCIAEDKH
jgi:hypothetical protein